MLYIHHREPMTRVLGPGDRYALWVQGCKKNCPGCVSPESHALNENGYWMPVKDIVSEIFASSSLTGITISGGEPFLQAGAVMRLIRAVKEQSRLDVMIYSGYTIEELRVRGDKATDEILSLTDLLIDGEYIEEQNTGSIYRGSDNQRIHFLSPKYLPYQEQIVRTKNRDVEFLCRSGGDVFMVGIPAKGFSRKMWEKLRAKEK